MLYPLSLCGDIWHCSSQCFQKCREDSSIQPQGGALRGDLDVLTSSLKGWNCIYVFNVLSVHCNTCCIQPNMCLIWAMWRLCETYIIRLFICFLALPSSCLQESSWQRHISSLVGIHVCLMNNNNIYCLFKGQDTESTGRKQWNWAGMVVNNAGGRLPGFMVWDPAPNPHHHQVPLPSCDVL